MKRTSSRYSSPPSDALPDVAKKGIFTRWVRFWFTPADPISLHVIRILSGVLFLLWLLSAAGHQNALFGLGGWFDAQAYREAASLPGGAPAPFTWSILYLCGNNEALVTAVFWSSIGVLLLYTLGIATRITSILTWVVVVSFIANPAISYGANDLLVLPAVYLMLGYVLLGQWSRPLSPAARLLGTKDSMIWATDWFGRDRDETSSSAPSYAANLALRIFQIHFAIVVVTTGLHKLQYGDWWAGVAFWYPMHPPLETSFESIQVSQRTGEAYLFFMSLIQYVMLAWQLTFPLFAWRKNWRLVLVGGGLLGWIGLLFIMKMPVFGPVFFLGCLTYITADEWRAAINWIGSVTHLSERLSHATPDSNRKSAKVET